MLLGCGMVAAETSGLSTSVIYTYSMYTVYYNAGGHTHTHTQLLQTLMPLMHIAHMQYRARSDTTPADDVLFRYALCTFVVYYFDILVIKHDGAGPKMFYSLCTTAGFSNTILIYLLKNKILYFLSIYSCIYCCGTSMKQIPVIVYVIAAINSCSLSCLSFSLF